MGGAPFSREKINAREIALSSDENRSYQLWSRELQNVLAAGSADPVGVPFSCALSALSLTFTSGFQMQLADGDAFFYFPTDPSLTVDDSPYEVLRWRSVAPLAFATPDGTNPRIDLVVAQPASADADLVSRNILVDPTLRTINSQSVFKTSNPTSIITVVTGTPAGSPVPPAVPAGKCALFEVLVPAAAPSAATFGPSPRLFRRAPFPWSVLSGIIKGCRLNWDLNVDITVASSTISLSGGTCVVCIDGEVIDCSSLTGLAVTQDAANNPFSVAAGASDKPYYIYLVGGRHAPQGTIGAFGFIPIAIIESLTPPNADTNQPNSPLTTARGSAPIPAATYIGVGFVVAGTTRRRPCIMGDEMTEIVGSDFGGFLGLAKTGTGPEALGIPGSKPTISRRVVGQLGLGAASVSGEIHLHPDRGDGVAASPTSLGVGSLGVSPSIKTQVAGKSIIQNVTFFFNPANATIWVAGVSINTGDVIQFYPMAYDHRVRRFGSLG